MYSFKFFISYFSNLDIPIFLWIIQNVILGYFGMKTAKSIQTRYVW